MIRLPGPDGAPGKGLRASEAVRRAGRWWNATGRYFMPEASRRSIDSNHGPLSDIYAGVMFENLHRESAAQVVRTWYINVWQAEEHGDAPTTRTQ